MKDNPFTPWGVPETLIGRKDELQLLGAFLEELLRGRSGLLLIRGGPWLGKSTLLKIAEKRSRSAKALTAFVKAGKRESEAGLAHALRLELQEELAKTAAVSIGSLGRSRQLGNEPVESFAQLLSAVGKAAPYKPITLIIDDVDNAQQTAALISSALKATEGKATVSFLFSTTRQLTMPAGAMSIALKPVEEHDFREYVDKLTKKTAKMGDECFAAVFKDSAGVPGILQRVVWHLYNVAKDTDKIITRAHYSADYRAVLSLLSQEIFSSEYFAAAEEEKKVLKQVAKAGAEGTSIVAAAKAIGKKPGPVATLFLRLENKGDVVKLKRGIYRISSPLYGRFVLERS